MKWTNKDWIWLIITLLGLGISFCINDPSVNDILSFISSYASMALACVAIYISIREATKVDETNREIQKSLGKLDERTTQIDQKLNKIEINTVNHNINNNEIDNIVKEMLSKMNKIN